ncbi:MAG: hypothetical protein KJN64_03065 [Ignavibacteria bacterium]|nr:hypothetical protein [Ignavibacteria bacterium]MBT8382531.1 hypothetical protein [Ignavibacteria bacterium]
MKTNEKIIKYLENQLTAKEKVKFEKQLAESKELQKDFKRYAFVNLQISELKNLESNPLYFNSILPKFWQKQQTHSKAFVLKKYASAFSAVIMLVFSFIFISLIYSEGGTTNMIQFAESLTEDEKIEVLKSLNGNTTTEYLNELYIETIKTNIETELSKVEDKYLIPDAFNVEIKNIEDFITEDEFDNIYYELIGTKFLKEEEL